MYLIINLNKYTIIHDIQNKTISSLFFYIL